MRPGGHRGSGAIIFSTVELRKRLIVWLYEHSQRAYVCLFKHHAPWGISRAELLTYPDGSLGRALGLFLEENDFELIPKVERHDVFHALTGYGTRVEDEIALQYLCFGNGKRSLYLYCAVTLGTILLPEELAYYRRSFGIGKRALPFHDVEYRDLLNVDLDEIRSAVFSGRARDGWPEDQSGVPVGGERFGRSA